MDSEFVEHLKNHLIKAASSKIIELFRHNMKIIELC